MNEKRKLYQGNTAKTTHNWPTPNYVSFNMLYSPPGGVGGEK